MSTPQTVLFAQLSAAGLAMISAIFGVGMARLLWAQDLKFAQDIDTRRSKIEASLRKIIESQKREILFQSQTIEILRKEPRP